jgi:hypothetical protein
MGEALTPSYRGIVLTSRDALVLFTKAMNGEIAMINRRPHDRERAHSIASGNVFIYCEHTSSIKRWTDGLAWSPSRIIGNFLIYRELIRGFPPGERKRAAKRKRSQEFSAGECSSQSENQPEAEMTKEQERMLVGSLVESYNFKARGLVKKTISVKFGEQTYHLVSYYNIRDAISGVLVQPTQHPHMIDTEIIPGLIQGQSFRFDLDIYGNESPQGNRHSSRSPEIPTVPSPEYQHNPYVTDNDDRYSQGHHQTPVYGNSSYTSLPRFENMQQRAAHYPFQDTPSTNGGYLTNESETQRYSAFSGASNRAEQDNIGIYSHSVPRQLPTPYQIPATNSECTTFSEVPSRPYSLGGSVQHAADGTVPPGVCQYSHHNSRPSSYSSHYGTTDPSSYANSMPSLAVLARGYNNTTHPVANPITAAPNHLHLRPAQSSNNDDSERNQSAENGSFNTWN